MKKFVVKSNSFALLKAFKEDCEKLGWVFVFPSVFNEENICEELYFMIYHSYLNNDKNCCQFTIYDGWKSEKMFYLETQYGEALERAKEIISEKKEPKFKEGDWVRGENFIGTVREYMSVSDHMAYRVLNVDGIHMHFCLEDGLKPYKPQEGEYFYVTIKGQNGWAFVAISRGGKKRTSTIVSIATDDKRIYYGNDETFCGEDDQIQKLRPATHEEIKFLDDALEKEGKRFNKEKMRIEDIPKYKKPIEGELAIFWDDKYRNKAIVCVFSHDDDCFNYHMWGQHIYEARCPFNPINCQWDNMVLFESLEQYKNILNGKG